MVSKRQVAVLLLILIVDALILQRIVGYQPSAGIDLLTIVIMSALVLAARKVPVSLLRAKTLSPSRSSRVFAVLGLIVTPVMILVGGVGSGADWPPVATVALVAFLALVLVYSLQRSIGSRDNGKQKVALATGLIIPISVFGFVVGVTLPVVALADLWMALYLRGLWRTYSSRVYEPLQLPIPTSTAG